MMTKWLLLLSCVVALASAAGVLQSLDDEWHDYKVKHNKMYESDSEEQYRKKIFADKLPLIAQHNQMFANGEVTYSIGLNQFSDWTPQELKVLNGYKPTTSGNNNIRRRTFDPPAHVTAPASVDWREKGAVTPIKNQGQCGSCWAYSSTGSLEGQLFLKTSKLVSLSEQNLVDCSTKQGNQGCDGGEMMWAFEYIAKNGGIDTEESYPYEGVESNCRYDPKNSGATVSSYVNINSGDEEKLMLAVATVGPVSVAIDVAGNFLNFTNGVFYEETCSSVDLDHAVLVVGYGTEDGKDYWLVKNSWGTHWGDNGYIKMSRNRNNNCGIATAAVYPVL